MAEYWFLDPDRQHLHAHGVDYDLTLVDEEMGNLAFDDTRPVSVESVPMRGNVAACRDTEFPITAPTLPMLSRRVYDILCATGPMPKHRFISAPTEAVPGGERRDDLGILQLLEHEDRFDHERSDFDPHPQDPSRAIFVRKFVALPFGDIPVPAIFRMTAHPYSLFISDRARAALEAARVRGFGYAKVEF